MKTSEKVHTLKSVNETDSKESSSKELIERTEIENTPFQVITTEEGSFGVLGKYRLTEVFENKEDAIKDTQYVTWNRIIQVIMLINETTK